MKRAKKQKPQARKKLPTVRRSQGWLASQLGCTQQRVSKLIAREGWRWPKRDWTDDHVAEILAWRDGLREENPATADAPPTAVSGGGGEPGKIELVDDELGELTEPGELLKLVSGAERRIKMLGVIERAAKTRLDRELLLGGYVKREEVEAGRVARVQAVRAALSNVRLLAVKMTGMSVIEMERILEDWAREVCLTFEGAGAHV